MTARLPGHMRGTACVDCSSTELHINRTTVTSQQLFADAVKIFMPTSSFTENQLMIDLKLHEIRDEKNDISGILLTVKPHGQMFQKIVVITMVGVFKKLGLCDVFYNPGDHVSQLMWLQVPELGETHEVDHTPYCDLRPMFKRVGQDCWLRLRKFCYFYFAKTFGRTAFMVFLYKMISSDDYYQMVQITVFAREDGDDYDVCYILHCSFNNGQDQVRIVNMLCQIQGNFVKSDLWWLNYKTTTTCDLCHALK